ncbi:hypothetical protein DRF65_09875 [Chryseobacterium pennae]|uniref:Shedu protein SduA C-terminal domain-containing protein n=1 Tax=Chryseobacterium pennae TaxID=2258962 RepID=A0A3D9C947_9FLAO|nr:Shedu immune nuclease family protein [Chryseobacterium pennae]REC62397.1 hypothetical protein DRF65_09875 [Chryseobacterium pennae]
MKLIYEDRTPILVLDQYVIEGWDSMPRKYPNQNAIVFSNDVDDDFLQYNLFDLIKKYRINDFPDHRIEIIIENIKAKSEPKILESIPYPFWGIKIGVSDNEFVITFEMIQNINHYEEEWDKKWTNEFYFDNISRMLEKEDDLEVLYEKDDYLILDLSVKLIAVNIESAVEKAIIRIKEVIMKVEASINGLGGFFEVIEIWNNKKINKSEIFWHRLLKKYSWLLSLIINEPVIIVEDEAYIGGKSIQNKKGNVIDFIYQNRLSENLALIEIKTPQTKIIGKGYRNTFCLTNDLTGSINQLLNYKEHFQKNYYSLNKTSELSFNLISPNSYLIIGNQENLRKEEKECFELYRKNLNGITIITFDELFEKAFFVLTMMNK